MKNNINFLIGLFLLLLLLSFPLSIQAITDLSPACNNEIASTVNDPSYPDVCEVRSQSLTPLTCCSSQEFNGLSIVSFMDSLGFKVSIGWSVLCPQKTVTFNDVSAGSGCVAEINTLCGRVNTKSTTCSLPQNSACCATTTDLPFPTPTPTPTPVSTCPNDCSGNGSCILETCICFDGFSGTDCSASTAVPPSTSEEEAIQAVQNNLQDATDLDNQALQKIDEGDYPSVSPIIDDATQSLTEVREALKTDPDLEQLREDEPSTLSKIDRSLQSSIKNHKKASSTIDRIVNDPKVEEDEELLSRLLKKAKRYLSDAIKGRDKVQRLVTGVVTSTRG